MEIDIQRIFPAEFNLRTLDERIVCELMKSIEANGLLQPIVVRPLDEKHFRIVFGSHRFEAVKRLGWSRIPAIVKRVSEEESFLMNVSENLLRNERINPVAEAKGYKQLIEKGWTIHEIALKIGKSDSYVCDRMRVLDKLHPQIQRLIQFPRGNRRLSLSHAEHLSLIQDQQRQLELARLVEERGLSVRQLERLVRKTEAKITSEECLCNKCPQYPCKLYVHDRKDKKSL
jgi:ParB family chromosome partitioning protein